MKKLTSLFVIAICLIVISCGNDKKEASSANKTKDTKNEATKGSAKNFNTEVDTALGSTISELSFTEKADGKEITGKHITKYFEDANKVIVTVYKKANTDIYDAIMYTINKADSKGLKADLTPMNDGSDNVTTYTPKDFGAVSLVFTTTSTNDTKIVSRRNLSIFMDEKKDEASKENGFKIPVKDFKSAEEWVKKLAAAFKK
jgi:hypothetical protein